MFRGELTKHHLRSAHGLLISSMLVGGVFFFVDTTIDWLFFYDKGFFDLLLFDVPLHELYVRVSMFFVCTIFGIYLFWMRKREVFQKQQLVEKTKNLEEINRALQLSRSIAEIRRDKYLGIANLTDEIIMTVSRSGQLTFINEGACAFFGDTSEHLLSTTYAEYVHPDDLEETHLMFSDLERKKRHRGLINRQKTPGGWRWVEWHASAIFGPELQLLGFQATGRDITEQRERVELEKAQYRQMVQANKMVSLGTLVSGVSHEINNPNQYIMSHLELLQDIWSDIVPILDSYADRAGDFAVAGGSYSARKDQFPAMFANTLKGTRRIQEIVQHLRSYVSATSDEKDPVNLNEIVESATALLGNMLKKTNTRLTMQLSERVPVLIGNSQRLQQVMINLIQNACEAIEGRDRRIELSTIWKSSEEQLVFTVKDNGCGMSDDQLRFVVDPFYTTKSKSGEGGGLGLAISSKIAAEHGGRLEFESELGQGTKVSLILPVVSSVGIPHCDSSRIGDAEGESPVLMV